MSSGAIGTKNHLNVDDAANQLPEEVRTVFKEAFYRCEVLDLYDGMLSQYFRIIVQTIQEDKARIKALRKVCHEFEKASNAAFKLQA